MYTVCTVMERGIYASPQLGSASDGEKGSYILYISALRGVMQALAVWSYFAASYLRESKICPKSIKISLSVKQKLSRLLGASNNHAELSVSEVLRHGCLQCHEIWNWSAIRLHRFLVSLWTRLSAPSRRAPRLFEKRQASSCGDRSLSSG